MEMLKANRLEQALNELKNSNVSKEMLDNINFNVQEVNKRFYHVALLRRVNNPVKEEYESAVVIQIYNKRGFENLKKNIKTMPISKIVVTHDPTLEKEDEVIVKLSEAELKEKLRAEILEEINSSTTTEYKTSKLGDFNPETASYHELVKFAKENEIELGEDRKQSAVKSAVLNWAKQ